MKCVTLQNIKQLVTEKTIHDSYKRVRVQGDGHCFLYSVVKSLEIQLKQHIDLEQFKGAIISEVRSNINRYIHFFYDSDEAYITNAMLQYIDHKRYDTDFNDVIPLVAANVLQKCIVILNNFSNVDNMNVI